MSIPTAAAVTAVASSSPGIGGVLIGGAAFVGWLFLLTNPINRALEGPLEEIRRTENIYHCLVGETPKEISREEYKHLDGVFAELEARVDHPWRNWVWKTTGHWKPPIAEQSRHMRQNGSWGKWKLRE